MITIMRTLYKKTPVYNSRKGIGIDSILLSFGVFSIINPKKFKFLSILAFIALYGCSTDKYSQLEELNLQGAVSEYRTITYDAKEENGIYYPDEKQVHYNTDEIHVFDEIGRYKFYGRFDADQELKLKSEFSKLSKNITQVIDSNLEKKTRTIRRIEYKSGFPRVVEYLDSNGQLTQKNELTWENNNLTKVVLLSETGERTNTLNNEHKNNQLITQTITDSVGGFDSQVMFILNELNDIKVRQFRDKNLKAKLDILSKYTYKYDKNGNWTMSTEYDSINQVKSITLRQIKYSGQFLSITNEDFLGTWFEIGGRDWIDFKEANNYDFGNYENIENTGKWTFEEKLKTLTLRANKREDSKKFSYRFFGNTLVLSTLEGREIMRLIKKP